eukprot:809619-Amphidinium_carterae.1
MDLPSPVSKVTWELSRPFLSTAKSCNARYCKISSKRKSLRFGLLLAQEARGPQTEDNRTNSTTMKTNAMPQTPRQQLSMTCQYFRICQ